MTGFLKKYYLSLFVSLIIMWLSLSDSDSINPAKIFQLADSDKIAHFLAYGGFTLILLFDSSNHKINGKIRYSMLLVPLIFGSLMELLQYLLTKTRQADFFDFLADAGGVAGCLLFILLLRAVIPVRETK